MRNVRNLSERRDGIIVHLVGKRKVIKLYCLTVFTKLIDIYCKQAECRVLHISYTRDITKFVNEDDLEYLEGCPNNHNGNLTLHAILKATHKGEYVEDRV